MRWGRGGGDDGDDTCYFAPRYAVQAFKAEERERTGVECRYGGKRPHDEHRPRVTMGKLVSAAERH